MEKAPTFKVEKLTEQVYGISSMADYRRVTQIGGKFDGCSEIVLDAEVGRTIKRLAAEERGDPVWYYDYSWR